MSIEMKATVEEFLIQEILDHKKDNNGCSEYKVKISQLIWVKENIVESYKALLETFWKSKKALKGEEGQVSVQKELAIENEQNSKNGSTERKVENKLQCENLRDLVATAIVDNHTSEKDILIGQQEGTDAPSDTKVLSEKVNVKKPSRKRNRKSVTIITPWRSKRLKENDEKLAASNFVCKECKKSFRTEDIYTAHMLDHENIDEVVSRINDLKGFRDELSEDLFEVKVWEKRKEYKCRLCAHLFLYRKDAKSHQRIHDGTNPWYCATCKKHFVRKDHYARHSEIHNGVNNHKCPAYRKNFSQLDHLSKHRASSSSGESLTCHLCQQVLNEKTLLDAHLAIHKVNSTFYCELCDQYFTTKPEYDVHMKRHENLSPENCLICGQQFLTKSEYELHSKTHEYEIYRCHACGEMYHLLEDLEMHYQMSENCLDVICTECNVEFATLEELRCHLRVCIVISSTSVAATDEQNEEIFVCRFCQRGYHLQTSFDEHMNIHYNAEKPIKCANCNHVFDSDEKLNIHRKLVHECETKIPCVECGFLFIDDNQLKRHVKAVHLHDKIFKCLPCVRTFYLRLDFNKHLLSKQHLRKSIETGFHTDKSAEKVGKRLRCAICEKCFPTTRELKRHEYLHQRIQTKVQPEKLLASSEQLGYVGSTTLPVYYNAPVYNFSEGEQVVLTTEDQAAAFFNSRIKFDDSGLVYVEKESTTEVEKTLNSQNQSKQVASVSVQCDGTSEDLVESVQSCDQDRSTFTVEGCSEETFLVLSEMVKEGKIDISSFGMIDSATTGNQ